MSRVLMGLPRPCREPRAWGVFTVGAFAIAATLAVGVATVAAQAANDAPPVLEPTPAPTQTPAAAVSPVSSDCLTPGITITGSVPLPNVQKALKERKQIKIMTIGASGSGMVHGTGQPYFGIVEGLLETTIPGVDVTFIDRGVSGELARQVAARLKAEVALASPDLILWQAGGPDAMAQVSPEEFEADLDETVGWLTENGIDVVLVGVQYVRALRGDAKYQAIRLAVQRVAERRQVLRVGRYDAMQMLDRGRDAKTGAMRNEFALSETGQACLAEYVVRAITTGVFLRLPAGPRR